MSRKKMTPEEKAAKHAAKQAIVKEATAHLSPAAIIRLSVKWPEQTAKGAPKPSYMNALKAIEELKLVCKLDVFHGTYTINGTPLGGFVGELSDMVTRKIRELAFIRLGLEPGLEHTYQATLRECEEHRFDPLLDYFEKLPKWDGKERLNTWLSTYLGVRDTPLVREQGRIVLVAAVARIHDHGVKFDSVLVLEGLEGIGKSRAVQVLANGHAGSNENFSDSTILHADERKQQELTKGIWFYEIAELAGMKKADQFAVKNFITKQEERARPAYGRFQEVQPRVCIFIGTFNTSTGGELVEYLNIGDQRRWWPMKVGKINIKALERDRDQLFAEALLAYKAGSPLWLGPKYETEAKAEAAKREKTDPILHSLSSLYAEIWHDWETLYSRKGTAECLSGDELVALRLPRGIAMTKLGAAVPFAMISSEAGTIWVSSKHVFELLPVAQRSDGNRVAAVLRSLGWRTTHDRRCGSVQVHGYEHDITIEAVEAVEPSPPLVVDVDVVDVDVDVDAIMAELE